MPLTWTRTADEYPEAGWDLATTGLPSSAGRRRPHTARQRRFLAVERDRREARSAGLRQSGVLPSQTEAAIALRDAWRARPLAAVMRTDGRWRPSEELSWIAQHWTFGSCQPVLPSLEGFLR